MKWIALVAAVAGTLAATADFFFRASSGYRVGYEQAVELLLIAVFAAIAVLWRERSSREET